MLNPVLPVCLLVLLIPQAFIGAGAAPTQHQPDADAPDKAATLSIPPLPPPLPGVPEFGRMPETFTPPDAGTGVDTAWVLASSQRAKQAYVDRKSLVFEKPAFGKTLQAHGIKDKIKWRAVPVVSLTATSETVAAAPTNDGAIISSSAPPSTVLPLRPTQGASNQPGAKLPIIATSTEKQVKGELVGLPASPNPIINADQKAKLEPSTQTIVPVMAVDSAPETSKWIAANGLPTAFPVERTTEGSTDSVHAAPTAWGIDSPTTRSSTAVAYKSNPSATTSPRPPKSALSTEIVDTELGIEYAPPEALPAQKAGFADVNSKPSSPPLHALIPPATLRTESVVRTNAKFEATINANTKPSLPLETAAPTASSANITSRSTGRTPDSLRLLHELSASLGYSQQNSTEMTPTIEPTVIPVSLRPGIKRPEHKVTVGHQRAKKFDATLGQPRPHQGTAHPDKEADMHENSNDEAVKLIDLEGQDYLPLPLNGKSEEPAASIGLHLELHDGGHDGIKKTKKKQLVDKHFLASLPKRFDPMPAPATLTPVRNGYLGPILMEKQTLSAQNVEPRTFAQTPPHHDSVIESELRAGRIVEIIVPTALVEITTSPPRPPLRIATIKPTATMPQASSTTASSMAHDSPMLSTTVFHVPDVLPAQPVSESAANSAKSIVTSVDPKTESRISDIEIEVYDSTIDSIVASTNFRDAETVVATDRPEYVNTVRPHIVGMQDRFTQYIVDRTEQSIPNSGLPIGLLANISGRPEPAAIEIHINVSEGVESGSEDLELSYRPSDYTEIARMDSLVKPSAEAGAKPETKYENSDGEGRKKATSFNFYVEIIDSNGDNSTDSTSSKEDPKPVLSIHSDSETDGAGEDNRNGDGGEIDETAGTVKFPSRPASDELFTVDLRKDELHTPTPTVTQKPTPTAPLPPPKVQVDRDSDTIFYISNTEVKVGESLPTPNYELEQQHRRSQLETQFFPASYPETISGSAAGPDGRSIASDVEEQPQRHRFEEDIILSTLRNTAGSLKIFRDAGVDSAPALDVTYVGESIMEVEQSSEGSVKTTSVPLMTLTPIAQSTSPSAASQDIIIQPAILPEMSIGVPVIGELPPQIELKEIDFMPDEANQLRSGVFNGDLEESSANGNDIDRLIESSIQYGGDLIDEGAGGGGGFDGVETSYPFGSPAQLRRGKANQAKHVADFAHFMVNHGVSNLRKDELGVELASPIVPDGAANGSEPFMNMNISFTVAERMSNATAFSLMEEPSGAYVGLDDDFDFQNLNTLIFGLFIVLLPIVVTVSMFCALRYLYNKYQASATDNNDNTEQSANRDENLNGKNGGDSALPPSPGLSKESSKAIRQWQSNDFSSSSAAHFNSTPSKSNSANEADQDFHARVLPTPTPIANQAYVVSPAAAAAVPPKTSIAKVNKHFPTDTVINVAMDIHIDVDRLDLMSSRSVPGNCYAGPNGSVTKMTLKNNHLIVETEQRNDISRNARETKMHYTTADKDCIFVVEVARGIDSKTEPNSPVADHPNGRMPIAAATLTTQNEKASKSQEMVQIHAPPADAIVATVEQQEGEKGGILSPAHLITDSGRTIGNEPKPNTGLSQSDLSSSDSTDSNKHYSYGNQELYTIEQIDYTINSAIVPDSSTENRVYEAPRSPKYENGHSDANTPTLLNGVNHSYAFSNQELENHDIRASIENEERVQPPSLPLDQSHEPGHELKMEHDSREPDTTPAQRYEDEKGKAADIDGTCERSPALESDDSLGEIVENELQPEPGAIVGEQNNGPTKSYPTLDSTIDHHSISIELTDAEPPVNVPQEMHSDSSLLASSESKVSLINGTGALESCYDSLMSLPEPPSTEEINQLNDFGTVELNQLDSLPPPPPPPPAADTDTGGQFDVDIQSRVANTDGMTTGAMDPLQLKVAMRQPNAAEARVGVQVLPLHTNGGGELHNGHIDPSAVVTPAHSNSTSCTSDNETIVNTETAGSAALLSTPLTPPASPNGLPAPPPAASTITHFPNGICATPTPSAPLATMVDVNGSWS